MHFERNPAAALAFLAEVDRAIDQVCEAPERWPPYLSVRRFVLRRYPFSVVYRITGETVQVIAFAPAVVAQITGGNDSRTTMPKVERIAA